MIVAKKKGELGQFWVEVKRVMENYDIENPTG